LSDLKTTDLQSIFWNASGQFRKQTGWDISWLLKAWNLGRKRLTEY
jgi:hypothetical protein